MGAVVVNTVFDVELSVGVPTEGLAIANDTSEE